MSFTNKKTGSLMKKIVLILSATIVLASCSLIPEYTRPDLPMADAFPIETLSPESTKMAYEIGWKEYFKDPRLHRYIELALEHNRDLRMAVLNTEAARISSQVSLNERLPDINLGASKSRSKAGELPTGQSIINQNYTVNAGISAFELDFFGRVNALSEADLNRYLATLEGQKSAQIALIAQIARSYTVERLAKEQLSLANSTLRANQDSYNLVKQQVDAGIATNLDLAQSLGQVQSARVQVAVFERQLQVAKNILQELVGIEPTNLPNGLSVKNELLMKLPAGLSSEILLLRPDVMQAEYELKADNANIGAARAAFFPRITLTSTLGTASTHFNDLFSRETNGWVFSPSLTLPIFNWGKTQANVDLAHVRKNISVANYERVIQKAFREVSNGLVSLEPYNRQLRSQINLVNTTREQLELAESLYNNGIASYLDVLDAQRSLFSARQALLSTYHERTLNGIDLYAALGGGLVKEKGEVSLPQLQVKKD